MKKNILLVLIALVVSLQASTIRPIRKLWEMTQSDGTTIKVFVHGDGRVDYYSTLDNEILMKNASGDICYAVIVDGRLVASDLIAHENGNRTREEAAFLRKNDVASRLAELEQFNVQRFFAKSRKAIHASTDDGLGKYGQSGVGAVKSIGEVTIPVIMVEFSDTKFQATTTQKKMGRYYNTQGYHEEPGCVGSVKDYFTDQSQGKFIPTFDVVAKVTLSKSYKAYGKNNSWGDDTDVDGLVKDAIKAAKASGVDFGKFKDNAGNIQLVSILYAGKGEATSSNNSDLVWPCQMDFEPNVDVEGFHFNGYFVGNELDDDGSLMGMGVFCHEFGHALGLPDFYCTSQYSTLHGDPFSNWSIMDTGAYIRKGRSPIGYTAYERSYLGWQNIAELKDTVCVELHPFGSIAGESAVMLRNPKKQQEYFILENRHTGTWYPESDFNYRGEKCTFGNGLMVTHVTYDKTKWENNEVNLYQDERYCYLVAADGMELDFSASNTNLYGNGSQIPSFTLYDNTKLERPVYNIQVAPNGVISFSYLTPTYIADIRNDEIKGDGYYYDLQGRKVAHPTPGIYIRNGKKYVIK